MSLFPEIKAAIEQTSAAFDEFKKVQDRQLAGIKHEQSELLDRIESLEAKGMRPGLTAGERKADAEHLRAFKNWLKSPHDTRLQSALSEAEAAAFEHKDILVGTPSSGGYAVPTTIHDKLEHKLRAQSPLYRLVKRVATATGDFRHLVSLNTATSGWVGESGPRNATNTPTLREIAPTGGELYAYPQVSEWALDDILFSVEDWLAQTIADEFSANLSQQIISGNGTNKPTGILNTNPTAVTDENGGRAAGVIEFVASGNATAITASGLMDLCFRVQQQYLDDAESICWLMTRQTLAEVAKLTAPGSGQYLLQPSLGEKIPMTLLGFPVHTTSAMPAIAANSFPILFGNFRRGYVLADRGPVRITPDHVTNIGFVRFYVRRRMFGSVLNNDAIKALRIAV